MVLSVLLMLILGIPLVVLVGSVRSPLYVDSAHSRNRRPIEESRFSQQGLFSERDYSGNASETLSNSSFQSYPFDQPLYGDAIGSSSAYEGFRTSTASMSRNQYARNRKGQTDYYQRYTHDSSSSLDLRPLSSNTSQSIRDVPNFQQPFSAFNRTSHNRGNEYSHGLMDNSYYTPLSYGFDNSYITRDSYSRPYYGNNQDDLYSRPLSHDRSLYSHQVEYPDYMSPSVSYYPSSSEMDYSAYRSRYPRYKESPHNYHTQTVEMPSATGTSPSLDGSYGIMKGMPQYSVIKQKVDEAIAIKSYNVDVARERLEQLSMEYSTCHLVWMELSRLEMEQGNVRQCREVILKGLSFLPHSEPLLEKRVKVEERLRNEKGVIACAQEFLNMDNSRCVKSIVEAAIVVAKLGYGFEASELFKSLCDHHFFTQGGVTLDYIRFVFKTEDYYRGLSLLRKTLQSLTKHGPIWFFTFSVLEQHHTITGARHDISRRRENKDLTDHIHKALRSLESDLHWKVYYIAAQAQLRSFTHIRLWARTRKRYLRDYILYYPGVIRVCFEYLKRCVELCPEDFKWKVWLLAGRVEALAGNTGFALQVEFCL